VLGCKIEQEEVALACLLRHLDRFASRVAVAEQLPAGTLGPDLPGAKTLVLTIFPFEQVAIDLSFGAKARQLPCAARPLPWTGKT
jgi:hypothetical protein